MTRAERDEHVRTVIYPEMKAGYYMAAMKSGVKNPPPFTIWDPPLVHVGVEVRGLTSTWGRTVIQHFVYALHSN